MTPVTDLIRNFYRVLDKCNTELCEKTEHYLFVGIEVLKETANNCSADICNLKAMRIKIPDAPSSHTKPANSADIEIYFEAEIKWTQVANTISYPIHINRFNVIVIATSNNAMISWHLDNDGEQDNKYLHPHYHITVGGKKMEEAIENCTHNFGQTLIMRNPRFMHPPMDIILGIDFILNHYVNKKYASFFLNNQEYQTIVSEMKKLLWKPYALSFARNYCESISVDGEELDFNDDFYKKIIGK